MSIMLDYLVNLGTYNGNIFYEKVSRITKGRIDPFMQKLFSKCSVRIQRISDKQLKTLQSTSYRKEMIDKKKTNTKMTLRPRSKSIDSRSYLEEKTKEDNKKYEEKNNGKPTWSHSKEKSNSTLDETKIDNRTNIKHSRSHSKEKSCVTKSHKAVSLENDNNQMKFTSSERKSVPSTTLKNQFDIAVKPSSIHHKSLKSTSKKHTIEMNDNKSDKKRKNCTNNKTNTNKNEWRVSLTDNINTAPNRISSRRRTTSGQDKENENEHRLRMRYRSKNVDHISDDPHLTSINKTNDKATVLKKIYRRKSFHCGEELNNFPDTEILPPVTINNNNNYVSFGEILKRQRLKKFEPPKQALDFLTPLAATNQGDTKSSFTNSDEKILESTSSISKPDNTVNRKIINNKRRQSMYSTEVNFLANTNNYGNIEQIVPNYIKSTEVNSENRLTNTNIYENQILPATVEIQRQDNLLLQNNAVNNNTLVINNVQMPNFTTRRQSAQKLLLPYPKSAQNYINKKKILSGTVEHDNLLLQNNATNNNTQVRNIIQTQNDTVRCSAQNNSLLSSKFPQTNINKQNDTMRCSAQINSSLYLKSPQTNINKNQIMIKTVESINRQAENYVSSTQVSSNIQMPNNKYSYPSGTMSQCQEQCLTNNISTDVNQAIRVAETNTNPNIQIPQTSGYTSPTETVPKPKASPASSPARKRTRLDELPPGCENLSGARASLIEHKWARTKCLDESLNEHCGEMDFLEAGGNMLDYIAWRKRPRNMRNYEMYLHSNHLEMQPDEPAESAQSSVVAENVLSKQFAVPGSGSSVTES